MKEFIIMFALLATSFMPETVKAGIFGHRWQQPAPPAPSGSRTYSYPGQGRNPWDWHEAHRGYGVKIRGW